LHEVRVVVAEARRVGKVFGDSDGRVTGQETPERLVPSIGDINRVCTVVAGINIKWKTEFQAELFSCGSENKPSLSACVNFLKESRYMSNLLGKVGMSNTKALIFGRSEHRSARDVLRNASLMKRGDQRRRKDLIPLRLGEVSHGKGILERREMARLKSIEGFVASTGRGLHLGTENDALVQQMLKLSFFIPVHSYIGPKCLFGVRRFISFQRSRSVMRTSESKFTGHVWHRSVLPQRTRPFEIKKITERFSRSQSSSCSSQGARPSVQSELKVSREFFAGGGVGGTSTKKIRIVHKGKADKSNDGTGKGRGE